MSSLGVNVVAAIFMGGVLGYQLYISLHLFGAEALLGGSVGVALFRELAPVMAAIMVTGRAGAAMAAEIASMRISEQIDALEVMAVDPIEYLVAPRVLAGVIMMPLLSVFFAVVGSIAAAVVACGMMGLDPSVYYAQFTKVVDLDRDRALRDQGRDLRARADLGGMLLRLPRVRRRARRGPRHAEHGGDHLS